MLYGEWLYAKHTVFYDALPHFFCEFDIYDRDADVFLSTPRRRELLAGTPVQSVPVLHRGPVLDLAELTSFIGPSTFRTKNWRRALLESASAHVLGETDQSEDMEGLYIKWEDDHQVRGRYKWVRPTFLTAVLDSGTHWMDRPIVPNQLADPEVMYAGL